MRLLNFQSDSVLQSSLVFTILTFLQPAINFFLLPLYLRILTPSEYGIYTLLITITNLIAVVGGLKMSGAIIPFYYDCKTEEERKELLTNVISFIIAFNVLLGFVLIFIGPSLFGLIFSEVNSIEFFPLGMIVIATGLLSPIIEAYTSFLKNKKQIIKYGIIRIALVIFSVLLQVTLIYYYSLEGALLAKLAANILVTILVLYFIRDMISFQLDKALIKTYLKYTLPLIPFFFIFWIGQYVDRFVLEKFVSLAEIGVFGLLVTFSSLVTLASQALANSIQPFLFEAYEHPVQNRKRINDLLVFYVTLLFLFCSLLILFVSNIHVISPRDKYLEIIPYFYVAIIPTILNAFQYIFFNIFTYHKRSSRLSKISFITVGLQLIVLFLAIAQLKIYGAILASFIGNLVSLIWYAVESQIYIKVEYDWKRLLPLPILFILSLPVGYVLGTSYWGFPLIGLLFPFPFLFLALVIYQKQIRSIQLR